MELDKIIMNPPYSGNLHLKILSHLISLYPDAEVVNLSPIRWLQDPLAEYKKNSDWKKFENVRSHIESVDAITAKESSEAFGMLVSTDLGISYLDKELHNVDLRNKLAIKLFETNCHYEKFDINKKDGWRVRFTWIDNCKAGGSSKKGKIRFQRLLAFKDGMRDGKPWYESFGKCGYSKETDYIPVSLKFNSKEECNNFIDVMTNTKLGRYYWLALQQDAHVWPCFFLRLDYTHPWNDTDLYEYFHLSDDEIAEIEKEIK